MFPQLGPMEMVVIMGVAVLLFGKRLPEVGRSLGKGIIEFKKGLRGLEDDLDFTKGGGTATPGLSSRRSADDRTRSGPITTPATEPAVPKFEPPTEPAVPRMEYEPQQAPD
jgi:sec-independent protein translocase protein TatA